MQSRFKRLLEENNLTASRFAELIEVNASAVSHILNGRSKPGFDVLEKIARAFPDLDMNWLISGKGTRTGIPEGDRQPVNGKEILEKKFRDGEIPLPGQMAGRCPAPDRLKPVDSSAGDRRELTRIILFFNDGSFESYGR